MTDARIARALDAMRSLGASDKDIAIVRTQMEERVASGDKLRAMLMHDNGRYDALPYLAQGMSDSTATEGEAELVIIEVHERKPPEGPPNVELDDGLAAARGIGRAFLFWGAIIALVALAFAIGRVTSDESGRVRRAVQHSQEEGR